MSSFKDLSLAKKIGLSIASIFVVSAIGSGVQKSQSPLTATNQNVGQASAVNVSKQQPIETVEAKTETKTEIIPYTSTTKNDSSLASGTSKVSTSGVNGEQTLTYKVTYKNGKELSRELVSSTITKQPIAQITSLGTKTEQLNCPNGTYMNTYGNEVCSPYNSNSAPSGATAQCRDGTYSFSQSRSGTCSHHGGVETWL